MFWIFVFRSFLYLYFMVVLAGTCGREALLTDYVIAEKVSAFGILLMIAVYISSSSSCLATLYGTPRVLQSIASENVIPSIAPLAEGVRFISSQCCQLCLKIGVGTPDFFLFAERTKQSSSQSLALHLSHIFGFCHHRRSQQIGYFDYNAILDYLCWHWIFLFCSLPAIWHQSEAFTNLQSPRPTIPHFWQDPT